MNCFSHVIVWMWRKMPPKLKPCNPLNDYECTQILIPKPAWSHPEILEILLKIVQGILFCGVFIFQSSVQFLVSGALNPHPCTHGVICGVCRQCKLKRCDLWWVVRDDGIGLSSASLISEFLTQKTIEPKLPCGKQVSQNYYSGLSKLSILWILMCYFCVTVFWNDDEWRHTKCANHHTCWSFQSYKWYFLASEFDAAY